MEIGYKIKEKRIQLGLTQEELANRCELTKGYISQLENDKTDPSIQTLAIILDVLGISFKDFFSNDPIEDKVVYHKHEIFVKEEANYNLLWPISNAQNKNMEPMFLELFKGGKTDLFDPFEGDVYGYLLEGSINLCLANKLYKITAGESFYFTANYTYLIENDSEYTKIIMISTPPHF